MENKNGIVKTSSKMHPNWDLDLKNLENNLVRKKKQISRN